MIAHRFGRSQNISSDHSHESSSKQSSDKQSEEKRKVTEAFRSFYDLIPATEELLEQPDTPRVSRLY